MIKKDNKTKGVSGVEQVAGVILVAFADGTRPLPLTAETMETMTRYFSLRADGVFYYDDKKAKQYILYGKTK